MFNLEVETTCIKNFEKYGINTVKYVQGLPMSIEDQEAVLSQFRLPDTGKPTLFSHVNKVVSTYLIRDSSVTLECINFMYRPPLTVLDNTGMLIAGLRRIALVIGVNTPFLINNDHHYVLSGFSSTHTSFSV